MAERSLKFSNDISMVLSVVMVLVMLLVPLPKIIIDLIVSFNFTLAVVILLVTMYTKDAVQFNIFPTFLLVVTLFRLALGVLLTRALMLDADAGNIVQAFGQFVVGGNYVVGIMIFIVLVIIQFVVITGGAQRVAEVAARFTLDAMPGKQMSIDADLNSGLIDETTARKKREDIAKEADFYGAMDGATKFIRGDAIAAIIIILVNIIGGFVVGILQQGYTLLESLQTYTLLTVGAGLVLQVPALLISSATGIIVTKASSSENLGEEVRKQLFSNQRILFISSGVSAAFMLVPGMFIVSLLMAGLFLYLGRAHQKVSKADEYKASEEAKTVLKDKKVLPPEKIIPKVDVDAMEIEIGYGVIPLVDPKQGGGLLENITSMRKKMATELGIIIPPIRIRDNISLKPNIYLIKIKGGEVAQGEIINDRLLAMDPGNATEKINGFKTVEPTFNLPALWITVTDKEKAQIAGYTVVDPATVIITHVTEIIRKHASDLLGRQEVKILIDNVKEHYPAVVEELIPNILTIGEIQKVLAQLLDERVPIRNIVTILEVLADYARNTKNTDVLTTQCRQALSRMITKMYQTPKGDISVITLDPSLEQKIADSIQYSDQGSYTSLNPVFIQKLFKILAEEIEKIASLGYQPIILCSSSIRPHFRKLTYRTFPNLVTLSYNEIIADVEINALSVVRLKDES